MNKLKTIPGTTAGFRLCLAASNFTGIKQGDIYTIDGFEVVISRIISITLVKDAYYEILGKCKEFEKEPTHEN